MSPHACHSISRHLMILMGVSVFLLSTLPSINAVAINNHQQYGNPGIKRYIRSNVILYNYPVEESVVNYPFNSASKKLKDNNIWQRYLEYLSRDNAYHGALSYALKTKIAKPVQKKVHISKWDILHHLAATKDHRFRFANLHAKPVKPRTMKTNRILQLHNSTKLWENLKSLKPTESPPIATHKSDASSILVHVATNVAPLEISTESRMPGDQSINFSSVSSVHKEEIETPLRAMLQPWNVKKAIIEAIVEYYLLLKENHGSQIQEAELGKPEGKNPENYVVPDSANKETLANILLKILKSINLGKLQLEATLKDHLFRDKDQVATSVIPEVVTTKTPLPGVTSTVPDPNNITISLMKEIIRLWVQLIDVGVSGKSGEKKTEVHVPQQDPTTIETIANILLKILKSFDLEKSLPGATLKGHSSTAKDQVATSVIPEVVTTKIPLPGVTSTAPDPNNKTISLMKGSLNALREYIKYLSRDRSDSLATLGDNLFRETEENGLLMDVLRQKIRELLLISP